MPVNKKAALNNVRFLNPSSRQEKNPLKTDQQQPYRTAYLEHQSAIALSSELLPSGLFYEMPRQAKEEQRIKVPYKCTRCRNHGLIVPYRGHNCPCSTCVCEKCSRSTERTRLGNLQAKLKRREAKALQLLQSQAKGEAESNTPSKSEDPPSSSQMRRSPVTSGRSLLCPSQVFPCRSTVTPAASLRLTTSQSTCRGRLLRIYPPECTTTASEGLSPSPLTSTHFDDSEWNLKWWSRSMNLVPFHCCQAADVAICTHKNSKGNDLK
ncbi:uncharacterized protein LOC128756796 isoform X2 [Synchiropus splendidus]|uniref:uncharacterized protein LOC128756796 isoform X2 n=1 Tax=Synchiropus splendidus TaxID=270530 RepID=UPI00237E9E02|nr:uncharacterized protein LOC128756796 isoform X2 [Synchiropus splendidus]